MLHKTTYTHRQYGLDIDIQVTYEHKEAAGPESTEVLQVISTHPYIDLSNEVMEEIELHCWTDVVTRDAEKTISTAYTSHPLSNPDQEIPPCRMH